MQEIDYISCTYHAILFLCSKRSQIKFYTLRNKKELQIIEINHSADIDYKDLMNIYRKCKSEPYSFLTIHTTLPANDPLRFRKKTFHSVIKIRLADKRKIIDDKIKANQAHYDLDREAAKISALSFGNLDKYEYLLGEDLEDIDQKQLNEPNLNILHLVKFLIKD